MASLRSASSATGCPGADDYECLSFPRSTGPTRRELNRSVAHRKKVGNIKPDDLDIGWKIDGIVRAMIYDRQVSTPN